MNLECIGGNESEGCGTVTQGVLDGYSFGDRPLEGVKFLVTLKSNTLNIEPMRPEDRVYLRHLNAKQVMDLANEWLEHEDTLECLTCHGDIDIIREDE